MIGLVINEKDVIGSRMGRLKLRCEKSSSSNPVMALSRATFVADAGVMG